jgi:hypothetical protein
MTTLMRGGRRTAARRVRHAAAGGSDLSHAAYDRSMTRSGRWRRRRKASCSFLKKLLTRSRKSEPILFGPVPIGKSFLLLFFKKEGLASFLFPMSNAQRE